MLNPVHCNSFRYGLSVAVSYDACMTTPDTLTTRDVAEALGINPRDLRVFLRSCGDAYEPPGSGGRYSFTKSQIAPMKKAYAAFVKERDEARSQKAEEKARALAVVADHHATDASQVAAS